MAKNLNVSLAFTANASQAKAELNALKKSLNELVSGTALKTPDFKFTKDIQDATRAAAQLKTQLDSAMNVKTGNLDLTKFSESMTKSGMSLEKYQNQLYQLGPAGEKAFADLTRAITMADVPLKRSGRLLNELWTTMKNTARWQLTSSAMHGFMGAVQSAYGYAKDLNSSLNEIRIVTGASTDKMAQFAKEANNAAKALSTTTTDYTNASLIFYQQGLADSQVKERTDITIKMANAAGASAEKVSDQLTAVWNNFYDGSKSLEYYADVMTALGAATASSTDEISEGLQKFAAVADTVGLSYEYATAALATITSNTRESADVVGNALKTLFARIQGLKLGETLEDGVDLNKYSEALDAVGIKVLDSNGELKAMDTLLTELADKWDTIGKAEQTALAQTVAGVRQYTQLIALMDNWDNGDSDSMMANLQTANNATGTLQEQADIYADSWEASSKKVKASLEAVYSALLKDDFFIDLNNLFAGLIDGVKIFIDSLGGVKGVLLTIGGLVTNIFSKQIAQSIQNAAFSIKGLFNPKAILDQEMAQKKKANELLVSGLKDQGTTSSGYSAEAYKALGENQLSYIQNAERMSEEELSINQILMDRNRLLVDNAIQEGKELEQIENKIEAERRGLTIKASRAGGTSEKIQEVTRLAKEYENLKKSASGFQIIANTANKNTGLEKDTEAATALKKELSQVAQEMLGLKNVEKLDKPDGIKALTKAFQDLNKDIDLTKIDLDTLWKVLNNDESVDLAKIVTIFDNIAVAVDKAGNKIVGTEKQIGTLKWAMHECGMSTDEIDAAMKEYNATLAQYEDKAEGAEAALKKVIAAMQNHNAEMDKTKVKSISYAEAFSIAASAVMTLTQALTTIKGIIDVFNDENATKEDFVWALISGLGMLTISISSLLPQLTKLTGLFSATGAATAGATPAVAGFGTALNYALGPIGWVALALTALVGIAAIVISTMDTATEKAQKHFEQMSKEAEKAAETLDEAKNAYENLNDTITAYTDARNSIDNLTEGTVEFKNAILEANEAARTLIELYSVASKYNAETGLIEIKKEDLEQAQAEYQDKLESARINSVAAQTNKIQAQNRLENAKIAEKDDVNFGHYLDSVIVERAAEGAAIGAGAAAAGLVTTVAAPITAAIGAAIGIVAAVGETGVHLLKQNATNEKQIDALENLQDLYDQNGGNLEKAMASLDDADKALIESLGATDSELDALCSELSANTAAILQNNKQIIDDNFKDNAVYENSKYKDELNTLMADELTDKTEQIYNEKYSQSAMTDKKAQQAYAEMMDYTWVKNAGNNNGVYSKGDGSQNFTISDETARQALAQRDAIEALNGSLVEYNNTLQRIAETGQSFDKDVSDLLLRLAGGAGASFGDASGSEITALENKINADGFKATDLISNTDAQNMGYDDAKTYVEALRAAIDSYHDRLTNVGKNLATSITQGFLTIEDLSADGAESMARSLTEAFTTSGKEAANLLDEIFVEAGDHADELSSILEDVDWGDPNAAAKLNAKIKEQGLNVDTTSEAWINYVEAMSKAGIAVDGINSKFEILRSTLITVKEAINGLSTNDIISDETYEELMAINPLIKDLFMITEDGYKFIGDQGDLSTLLTGNIKEKFSDVRAQFDGIRSDMERVNTANWFNEDGSQAYSSNKGIADIAFYSSADGSPLDNALMYMHGITKDSLAEAATYLQKYTDDDGNIDTTIEGFDQTKYDNYLAHAKDFYDQLAQMQQNYTEGGFEDSLAQELTASQATSIEELNNMVANGDIDGADSDTSSLNAYEKQLQSLISTGMQAATTIGELQAVIREGEASGGTIDYNQYADALIRIGSEYNSVTQEVEAYQAALLRGNEEQIDYAAATLEASIRAAELGEQYDISAEEIENYAEELKMSGEYMEANEKALVEMAKDQKRFDKAVISASKNMSKWKKDLDVAQETGHLVSETATEMAEAYGNLLDIDPSSFSQKFLQDPTNLENMKLALEGNEEAYKSLQAAAKEDIAFQIGLDTAEFDSQFNALMDKYWQGKSLDDIAVGASLDNEGFLQGLTDMVNAAGMTAQQATDYLSSMGVDAEVINEPETVQETVGYNTIPQFDYRNVSYWPASQDGGAKQATAIYPTVRYNTYPVTVPKTTTGTALKVTSASKSSGGAVKHSGSTPSHGGSNSGGGRGGGGGGGGGKSSTPAEKVDISKPSDFGERYHTINKQIDNMGREMERASKAADKLWSRKRLKYLEEQNKMLDEEIALLQEKTRQAEEYLKQDTTDLNSAATDLGFTISYGSDGEILNYDAIRDAYAQQMIAAQEHMNNLSTKEEQDAYQESVIDPLQKKIDAFEEAMELYYDSLETIQENADLIQEKLDQKLQNNFDMWAGELELDIAINERDLELLEYYLGKIEDDVYQMAEAAALMIGSLDGLQSGNFGGQLGEYLSQLGTYNTKLEELNQKLAAGEITEAAYEEGLETIRSGLLDNLQAIQELDNAMLEYYSNTLDAVMEEMDKYTEKLEHQTSILEHYANMMEILGKSYDYRSMGEILEGQVKTLENELKVAEAEYDLYKSEAEEKRKLYEEAVAAGNVEAAEVYKKEWEAAEAAAMEAQSEMLDKTEAWAEAMRAVVENNLKGLAKTLEESLTGGTTFDQINLQLERAASLQEEYLTTTNKIYETNKLMRKAQQEIDKSSNTVAKQRLKDFIKETNQLQDKSKLSKYELEIQQAKYDLLLAQLALEDAQNAKSTVRLQRDSEGNFGYVYTADQNKLAEAQQALEDAQNSLYNIGLEGANDYTEKYAETMQEMYDTLTSITEAYFNGEIASQEEYEAQMLAAQQYYYEQLENYQDLYGIALQTDTRVIKDAWSTGMQIMTIETGDWKNAVKEYTNDATKALVDWYAQVDAIANKTGLDNIANKVKQITDESDKLKDKILGTNGEPGVIQALADELTAVSNLTGGYANLRATLQGLIEDYEELMRTVVEAQNTETPIDSDTPNDNPEVPKTEVPNTEDPTSEIPEDTDPATTNPEDVDAPILKKGDSVTVKSTATHFSRNGGNGTRMRSFVPGSTYSVMDFDDDEVMIGRNGVVTGWVKKTDLVGFNTGGYTGSWGPYGKLAILDEKELVLNQGDTANFLASMEVLERILEMLDVQSASAQLGGLLSTPIFGGNNTSSSVEQNVHIEASFPSVTDRNEIEEAFNNLINTASQYANRKI